MVDVKFKSKKKKKKNLHEIIDQSNGICGF
jgi:hypothetical protein